MAKNEPGSKRATIYDVAEHAGVAISTVSRVLNDSPDVSDSTRELVRASIAELQFRPNRTAKSLAQQQVPTFAIALPTFITPFHNELLKGVREGLRDVTADLLICDLAWVAPRETLYNFLKRGAVDGLMVAGVAPDNQLAQELDALGAPTVLIGQERQGFHSFWWDEVAGARLATQHLIDKGHEKIAIILPPIKSPSRNARFEGYREALSNADIPFDEGLALVGKTEKHAGFSEESGYEAMNELLDSKREVTAVFAGSDVQAIGALYALQQRGLRAPDDLAIIGYDDIKTSSFIGLSSVAQHMLKVGHDAAQLLIRHLNEEPSEPVVQRVEPELRVRETS